MASVGTRVRWIVIGITGIWFLLLGVYIANRWYQFSISYHPPLRQGTYWNNFWLSGGRFSWSRYDPVQSPYPVQYQPPDWRTSVTRDRSGYWFWKAYFVRQYGGHFTGVPLWIPLAMLVPLGPAPATVLGLKAWRRQRYLMKRLCPSCGYPTEGLPVRVCPECGLATEIV
jgi:hypothetical protein